MLVFLLRHLLEHFGAGGIVVLKFIGVVRIDAPILLFIRDGESEDFAFGEFGEIPHGRKLLGFAAVARPQIKATRRLAARRSSVMKTRPFACRGAASLQLRRV